jgi:spermidine/putrescine transport system substrate-binding protein
MSVAALRVLCWPGMPAAEALAEAGRHVGVEVHAEAVASNERLEDRMRAAPFDIVFPSDYLVERLVSRGELLALGAPVEVVGRIAAWAREAPHDPGCLWSLPFAFGTTGYLCDARLPEARSWMDLLRPRAGTHVGMLAEVREVLGAALIAVGHSPNDASPRALERARELLRCQRPSVVRYDSDDFVGPVVRGEVTAHQAWSGPAAAAVRAHAGLRYVVPDEGAGLWITTGAVPASARDANAARAVLAELTDPALAALTTRTEGYATPNEPARERLPATLRDDETLFPADDVLRRCHTFHDLGDGEARLARVYEEVADATNLQLCRDGASVGR